jgi:hypothetical protein
MEKILEFGIYRPDGQSEPLRGVVIEIVRAERDYLEVITGPEKEGELAKQRIVTTLPYFIRTEVGRRK